MSGESGRFFNINGVGSVMSATLNEQITLEEYVSSNTGGGTASGGGIIDWTATASGKSGSPPIFPNQELPLLLYSHPDSGVEGGDGQRTLGTGICSEISITWNNTNNQLTSWTANFASRSSLSRDVGAPFLDTTALSQDYPCGTFPTFDDVSFQRSQRPR